MKILIQRVAQASVEVGGKIVGAIGPGLLTFLGVTHGDTITEAQWLAAKLLHLRMFEDAQEKINLSVTDRKGSILIISQFTLYADCNEGRRPSFTKAGPPDMANRLYEQFVEEVRKGGLPIETGIFGAKMNVSLVNDGPFTLLIEKSGLV
jgi:D-tyrosyl-tRNA(Tyr) deacylase